MNEVKKKRSRKSKLVPREAGDNHFRDNIQDINAQKLERIKKIKDSPPSAKFDVEIEVTEFEGDSDVRTESDSVDLNDKTVNENITDDVNNLDKMTNESNVPNKMEEIVTENINLDQLETNANNSMEEFIFDDYVDNIDIDYVQEIEIPHTNIDSDMYLNQDLIQGDLNMDDLCEILSNEHSYTNTNLLRNFSFDSDDKKNNAEFKKKVKRGPKSKKNVKKPTNSKKPRNAIEKEVFKLVLFKCNNCTFIGQSKKYNEQTENCCSLFVCNKCSIKFETFHDYLKHFSVHNIDKFTCPECKRKYGNINALTNHMRGHISGLYETDIELNDEIELTEDATFKCMKCDENVVMRNLIKHWDSHLVLDTEVDELIENEVMDRGILRAKELSYLIGVITTKELNPTKVLHTCDVCGDEFDQSLVDLILHHIEHLLADAAARQVKFRLPGLKCQICRHFLWQLETFRKHMRGHANLPLFRCRFCLKFFNEPGQLDAHKETVHNIKDQIPTTSSGYNASICKKHVKTVRNVMRKSIFFCRYCRKKFQYLMEKWEHQWAFHKVCGVEADCPICKKIFEGYEAVLVHMLKVHKNVSLLDQVFKNISRTTRTEFEDSSRNKPNILKRAQ